MRRKKATKCTRQYATGDACVVRCYKDDDWNAECPWLSFASLASLMFLLGDMFEGNRQQEDPASVPLLTPHAAGGIDPPPQVVAHGVSAFDRACAAVWGCEEQTIVLLVPAPPASYPDETPVPEVVRLVIVRHDPCTRCSHVAAGRWSGGAGSGCGLPAARIDGGVGRRVC